MKSRKKRQKVVRGGNPNKYRNSASGFQTIGIGIGKPAEPVRVNPFPVVTYGVFKCRFCGAICGSDHELYTHIARHGVC